LFPRTEEDTSTVIPVDVFIRSAPAEQPTGEQNVKTPAAAAAAAAAAAPDDVKTH